MTSKIFYNDWWLRNCPQLIDKRYLGDRALRLGQRSARRRLALRSDRQPRLRDRVRRVCGRELGAGRGQSLRPDVQMRGNNRSAK